MAIKKSQIYSMLWNSCDALRGSMDASQYKDYVLIMLFVKYLNDKEDDDNNMFEIPNDCHFSDFVALKGSPEIGEEINKKLAAIQDANSNSLINELVIPNFNDEKKLGNPKEKTSTLSKLIAAFERSDLDLSKNRSADDDLLGDAYEYLLKNFASESGKSKGEFYTPAEVSRTMAKILKLDEFTSRQTTIYDPTCGSGSLLLRAVNETPNGATPYGQEKDISTASLAILNMLLHGMDVAQIKSGDTINNPQFIEGGTIRTFDVCVANPPFSTKAWLGDAGEDDIYYRWKKELCPPAKCGDFAFLLHIIGSMKPDTGRGACILPHGVLFRGNAEYEIRKQILLNGYIEGIVGLPANVFFGTGIPAAIILINKKGAADRKGIFFIDAKDGFVKDGNKNRLREQDIKLITDTWIKRQDVPHYARFVPMNEIEGNNYNLNIPRYVQPRDTEIVQDISAHLQGGLPLHDVDCMETYWKACPTLKNALFKNNGDTYSLIPAYEDINSCVSNETSFVKQQQHFENSIAMWIGEMKPQFVSLNTDIKPQKHIDQWSQRLLDIMQADTSLVNPYDAYQQLLSYWNDTMQDDCYIITHDGWKATLLQGTKRNRTYEDMSCDLLPVDIVLKEYFATELAEISTLANQREQLAAEMQVLIDTAKEDSGEEDEDEIKAIAEALKKKTDYRNKDKKRKELDSTIKDKKEKLTKELVLKYKTLDEDITKRLVIDNKWIATITQMINAEMQQVTHKLTAEITALAKRYQHTLAELSSQVDNCEAEVNDWLKEMGYNF